jgi:polysaccharide export outer membrane protein
MKITFKYNKLRMKNIGVLPLVLLLVTASCVSNKEATYLQVYDESMYSGEYVPPMDYLIKPNDNIYLQVSTPDPTVSAFFNVFDATGGMMTVEEASAQLMSYPVELDGTVDLPYMGHVQVAGMTLPEAKMVIEDRLREYVTEFTVTVKLVNNYVSLLGEVRQPGMYPIYKERLNIFQALAMAGDVADFSKRYEVAIIRQTEGESIVWEFDITDKKIVDSEFYYVLPNDVIYVKPKGGRYFAINTASWTFALTTITAAISLFVLIQNNIFLRNQ